MNDRIVARLLEALPRPLDPGSRDTLRRFADYMDRHSLWICGHEAAGGVLRVTFTDERRHYSFSIEEMAERLAALARGDSFGWEDLE